MKKGFVVFLFLVVLLGGCFPKNADENIDHVEVYDKKIDLLIKDKLITPYSFEKEDKYYLYFGRNDCPYCHDFLPELEDVINKKEVILYYVDTNIKNEQTEELLNDFNVEYVPTLLKVEKEKNYV